MNEEKNVVPVCEAVIAQFKEFLSGYDYEIILPDNASKDKTRKLIAGLCAENKKIKAIFNTKNFGALYSPLNAISNATGDCVIYLPADFQIPVELIPQMVKEWENGFKIVCCVKKSSDEKKVMWYARTLFYKILKKASGNEQIEHFTGHGLFDKAIVRVFESFEPQWSIRGMVAHIGGKKKEVFYHQPKRNTGKSKFS
jgi:glycosyltransferase involved in cell wall biosynthesis